MKQFKWFLGIAFFLLSTICLSQSEKSVKVKTQHGKLHGSLILANQKKSDPIVLIIPDSGPTDRNGNSALLQTNNYKMLAESLAEEGISSLRYDKLLVGESKGEIEESDLRFDHNVEFAAAWIKYLVSKRFTNIITIGHSEGSLIGMLASQNNEVSKFISLTGTGKSIDKVLMDQLSNNSPTIQSELKRLFEKLKNGQQVKKVSPELAGMFRYSAQPYLISWIKYDPQKEIGKLDIPVLIIHGSADSQISMSDANLQKGGNSSAELSVIEGMNHILKVAPEENEEDNKSYFNPKLPLHPELIPTIVGFVK